MEKEKGSQVGNAIRQGCLFFIKTAKALISRGFRQKKKRLLFIKISVSLWQITIISIQFGILHPLRSKSAPPSNCFAPPNSQGGAFSLRGCKKKKPTDLETCGSLRYAVTSVPFCNLKTSRPSEWAVTESIVASQSRSSNSVRASSRSRSSNIKAPISSASLAKLGKRVLDMMLIKTLKTNTSIAKKHG